MPDAPQIRQHWHLGSPARWLRLVSGLILFAYVFTHLLNHALCNASIAAADNVLLAQKWIWQGAIGSIALYGALLIHMALGLLALYTRRHFRWSVAEALQLALGLAFPILVANHISVTRGASALYGLNKGYIAELASLWVASPAMGVLQMAVLVTAWGHACLGLFFLLRLRRWFQAAAPLLMAGAVLVPALAMLGFAQGGREVTRLLALPGFRATHLPAAVTGTAAQVAHLASLRNEFLVGWLGAIALVLVARAARRLLEHRRGMIVVAYPNGRMVRVARGVSILDASRLHGVKHAAVCGGRGRCSTCRVRLLGHNASLPPPAAHERALLESIGADPMQVRLACQLRPGCDVTVVPLIPPELAGEFVAGRHPHTPGEERFVAAMFIDLRGSTALAQRRSPFDSVFLLGRFVTAVTQAVVESGGRPVQFLGDGVLALFGLDCAPAAACRQALGTIATLTLRLDPVRDLFRQEAQHELRYGIGLHCGRAIVGEIGFGRHVAFTALGETINTAHRLQELARDRNAEAAVSAQVYAAAGIAAPGMEKALVRGHAAVMEVGVIGPDGSANADSRANPNGATPDAGNPDAGKADGPNLDGPKPDGSHPDGSHPAHARAGFAQAVTAPVPGGASFG